MFADPFKKTATRKIKETAFLRRLSGASTTKTPKKNVSIREDVDKYLEEDTLADEDALPTRTPVHVRSSPPSLYHDSPSTPGSSSLSEAERSTPVSASDAESRWAASLQPHQRTLRDRLYRVSNRVMHYIVDNETVVDSIAETYQEYGETLLQSFVERHSAGIDALSQDLDDKAGKMKRSCDQLLKQLAHDRKEVEDMATKR